MSIQDWARPYYRPGGVDPFLFYVVYGAVDLAAELAAEVYRSQGIPDGIDVMHYTSKDSPGVIQGFREGYVWNCLRQDLPEFAAQIAAASECVILKGHPADGRDLNYFRDVVGLLTHFLDHGGICVYDPQMFKWWQPQEWHHRIFEPAAPVPRHHVVILTSDGETAGETWFHSRGMRKFGRPDLSLHHVRRSNHPAVIDLFERFIEHQALGGVIAEGQPIRMASLPPGMTCLHGGDLDDPDFNNVHVEIRWPAGP